MWVAGREKLVLAGNSAARDDGAAHIPQPLTVRLSSLRWRFGILQPAVAPEFDTNGASGTLPPVEADMAGPHADSRIPRERSIAVRILRIFKVL